LALEDILVCLDVKAFEVLVEPKAGGCGVLPAGQGYGSAYEGGTDMQRGGGRAGGGREAIVADALKWSRPDPD